jgi:hypothetical protein
MDICLLQVPPTPATRAILRAPGRAACFKPARRTCLPPKATA